MTTRRQSPFWLTKLLSTMRDFAADIVVGPVRPRFPAGSPVSSYARRIYERDAQVATGEAVEWHGIGNALLRRDRCLAAAAPFDPRLGLSGGEDTVFLARLREQGRRTVWCAEAAVTEVIPQDKLATAYLLRRAFRMGQTTAFLPSALARPRWSAVLRWMLIGAMQLCVYGSWSIALRLLGRDAWLSAMAKAASGLGKVMWHPALHIRNYQLGRPQAGDGRILGAYPGIAGVPRQGAMATCQRDGARLLIGCEKGRHGIVPGQRATHPVHAE